MHNFEARESKEEVNNLLFEKENVIIKAQLQGWLTKGEAQSLKAQPVAITTQAQSYEGCIELKGIEALEYYCYNMVDQVLDHVEIAEEGSIMVIEHL
jgi:hypothetical protein